MKVKPGLKHEDTEDTTDLKTTVEYPETWELYRRQSSFRVFSPYIIRPGADGKPYIMAKWWWELTQGDNRIIEAVVNWPGAPLVGLGKELTGKESGHTFDPFQVRYLFEQIDRVDTNNEESLLSFCNRFGLLGQELDKIPASRAGIPWHGTGFYQESLGYFTHAVRMMQYTLRLFRDIKTEDPRLEGEQEEMRKVVARRHPELASRIKSADHLTIARARLMTLVNEHLGAVFPSLQLGIDGRLYPGHIGLTLLGIAYFQLHEVIATDTLLRECPNCQSLFVPRTARSRFCPAPENYDRSPCENRYNQMVGRTRKNIKEGKETVQEVATRLNRSVSEIKSWLETSNRKEV